MEKKIWSHIQLLRQTSPLIHNVTNYVVMNNTANALLAVGASPVMAHAKSEVKDMVSIASSVVINIGTLDEYWTEAMLFAAQSAHEMQKPWVLDPVGAGATAFRNQVINELLKFCPSVIRGNASEIMAIAKSNVRTTKGVDSSAQSEDAVSAAKSIVEENQITVCISGATDIIVNDKQVYEIHNGHQLMTKVTGLGCTASALVGAFSGVVSDPAEASLAAMALLGVAGEIAEKSSAGPGSLQVQIIDKLYNISEHEFLSCVKISRR